MDGMVTSKDDYEAAKEYFDLYMNLRASLREGKMELSDAEAYLAYKEKLLSKAALVYAQDMIAKI